jgi:subtilisin family serine protease
MLSFLPSGKVDSTIKAYMKNNIKRKIPVIICCRSNIKAVIKKASSMGGKIRHEYQNANAFSMELSPIEVDKLSEMAEVLYIFLDPKASLCLRNTADVMGFSYPSLFNLTGKNIGIGIIDSGVYPHPDIVSERNSIYYFQDLINNISKPYDDNGHGTFVCGCIASSGHLSSGKYKAPAPDANLCVIKAFNAAGYGYMSDIIKAVDILISISDKFNIRVICLPFEFSYNHSFKVNPLEEIIKKAISANIAVVAPSGNLGPQSGSIYFPGNINEVITVGGISCPDTNIKNYSVASFTGRGPTLTNIKKPDICAPCTNITSLSANTMYNPMTKVKNELASPYRTMSGTSAACALICGACAVILEKTPSLTASDLKSVLCLSTISLGENKFSQGCSLFIFDKIIK